ncbi:carboxymuconolactone decarboxylase family protein [Galbibacter mesophilus]|uniref:carboxymuconolactone decarboxylase family protein n=1 Tax=Galbibacter mesophilus TaxID=379069 RepID=UPI00191E6B65|nr:carboxymuconolactone decarboxylase family protein [Galbibacter mesophilus]MCM5664169.1 carboxymuconolactone decarboxylase family protein [Galbibacter mesophilus]
MTTTAFSVPKKEEVSEKNQGILNQVEKQVGFIPNLYAYYAKNDTALADYLALNNRKSTLRAKEKEVVNLVTSQINGCRYCQSAHTAIGKMNGFSEDEILEIRKGSASFDAKLDALAKFTAEVVKNRAQVSAEVKEAFFNAGYSEANLIDVIVLVGDKIISNYIHNLAGFEIDFPISKEL